MSLKREKEEFLVRDLIRLLEKLPANQEVVVDIPELNELRRFTGENYASKDNKEPIVVLYVEPLDDDE